MPYKHELANSLGMAELLSEGNREWFLKRLKTYGRKEFIDDDDAYLSGLKIVDAQNLKRSVDFTKAIAIDGSLASVEKPSVTALKIASVWGDLTLQPEYLEGAIDPSSVSRKYQREFSVGLLPGKDVFPKGKEGNWDTKFREEFFNTMFNARVHRNVKGTNLVRFLWRLLDGHMPDFPCPNCGLDKVDFTSDGFVTTCFECKVEVFITDYLSLSFFTASASATQPMLLMEQMLLHALIHGVHDGNVPGYGLDDTLFIADGPLRMFMLPEIARTALESIQAMKPYPAVVSFMKSGHIENIFENPKADEMLLPGHVALITDEMRDRRKGDIKKQAASGLYGKSFAYRTRDGMKRYGFMLPPKLGSLSAEHAHSSIIDEWFNYPHLRSVVDFIEQNASNANGPEVASLEIIGAANNAASLPYDLSKRLLGELVEEGLGA